jgi:hypothetical protein
MSNPNGTGGFKPGESGNAGGRPRSASVVRLWFMQAARDARDTIVGIMRETDGGRADSLRLQAASMVLDRAIGKPQQSVDMGIMLQKSIADMNEQELLDTIQRVEALSQAAPKMIETVLERDEPLMQTELDIDR